MLLVLKFNRREGVASGGYFAPLNNLKIVTLPSGQYWFTDQWAIILPFYKKQLLLAPAELPKEL